MAFFPDKPADSDEIRLGAKQIRDNFDGIINDGIVIPKLSLYGGGAPAASLGQTGECYIDTKTGNEYIKNNKVWEQKLELSTLYAAKSALVATREELADLAEEIADINVGAGTVGEAVCYSCTMFPANGIQNKGSYYWKDGTGRITVTMRFNSSYGSVISMNSTAAIIMPAGFRPAFDCYAPCYAENATWNLAALKCGYMYMNTAGTITVRFPMTMFTGKDFVCGQISYYASN